MSRLGAKWEGVPEGAIAASVADMEFGSPDVVVEAVRREAARGGGYPSSALVRAPVEAAARWSRRHGLVLDPERSMPIGSVTAALTLALHQLSAPGAGVVRLQPLYPPLVDAIASTGRRDLPVDLVRDGDRWVLDHDRFETAAAQAEVLLWVAPHNPTGRVFDREEVAAVAEVASRHDLVVLSDEIWADVLLDGAVHVPFAPVAQEVDPALAARTVTVVGTSKAWNLAATGAAVLDPGGEAQFEALHGGGHVPLLGVPPRTSLAAATAAWREGSAWLADTLGVLEANVEAGVSAWTRAFGGPRVTRPEGTYLCWLDLRGLVPDDDPMAVLAVPDGVVPSDGAAFGAPGFVRVNLATTPDEARTIITRVAELVGTAN